MSDLKDAIIINCLMSDCEFCLTGKAVYSCIDCKAEGLEHKLCQSCKDDHVESNIELGNTRDYVNSRIEKLQTQTQLGDFNKNE